MKVGMSWCVVACSIAIASASREQDPDTARNMNNLNNAISVLEGSKIVKRSSKKVRPRIFDELELDTTANELNLLKQQYQDFLTAIKQAPAQRGTSKLFKQPLGDLDPPSQNQADNVLRFEQCVQRLVHECQFLEEAARGVLSEAQNADGEINREILEQKFQEVKAVVDQVDLVSLSDSSPSQLEATSSNLGPEFAELFRQEATFQLMKEKYPDSEQLLRLIMF